MTKVAIVHDYLTQYGGAERVLEEFHAIWPDAPVMVAVHDQRKLPAKYKDWNIKSSWINGIPFARRHHQALLSLYPQAFESFDLTSYDLVISSSSGFAHGVLTTTETLNVCYCHSPPRFLWDYHRYVERERLGRVARLIVAPSLKGLRTWDRIAADRTDDWISTSRVVKARIAKFYGKKSTIIPPPVQCSRFDVSEKPGKYFLMLMRLVGWKRADIVVQACSQLNLPLVVAGSGRDLAYLKTIAGPSVHFFGQANDIQMRELYRDCKAFILPSEEDFGITPLEAMAAGRPIIAFGRGGVLDTVQPGITGSFFAAQTAESLKDALLSFEENDYDSAAIRRRAETFDSVVFRSRIRNHVDGLMAARSAESKTGDHIIDLSHPATPSFPNLMGR